jgi:hydroxypyruvate isomerase
MAAMSPLKQSVPEWCFLKDGMDPLTVFSRLKSMGYAGLEMAAPAHWEAAASAGLPLVNISSDGMQDGLNKPANRARLSASVRGSISAAKARGIPMVIVFSGNRTGQADADGMKSCVTAFRDLAATAETEGVTLAFEMLNSIDHADYMADSSAFGFDLARAVGSPRFRVLYDIYHMHRMGENVLGDILGNLDLICHLHIAGSPLRDFPGLRQEIDYTTIVREVTAAGYSGYWGQEFPAAGADPFPDLEAAVMLFNRYARGKS